MVLMLSIVLTELGIFASFVTFANTSENAVVQGGALAVLVMVLAWNGKQHSVDKKAALVLEGRVEELLTRLNEERVLKHKAIGAQGVEHGKVQLLARAAARCTCGTMESVSVLLEMP